MILAALAQGDTGATRPKPYFGRRPSTPCPRCRRRKPPTRSSHGRRRWRGVSSWFPGSLAAGLCGTGVFAVAAASSSRRAPVGSAGGLALLAAAGLGEWWRLVLVVLRRFRSDPGPIWAQKGRPLHSSSTLGGRIRHSAAARRRAWCLSACAARLQPGTMVVLGLGQCSSACVSMVLRMVRWLALRPAAPEDPALLLVVNRLWSP